MRAFAVNKIGNLNLFMCSDVSNRACEVFFNILDTYRTTQKVNPLILG